MVSVREVRMNDFLVANCVWMWRWMPPIVKLSMTCWAGDAGGMSDSNVVLRCTTKTSPYSIASLRPQQHGDKACGKERQWRYMVDVKKFHKNCLPWLKNRGFDLSKAVILMTRRQKVSFIIISYTQISITTYIPIQSNLHPNGGFLLVKKKKEKSWKVAWQTYSYSQADNAEPWRP